VGGLATGPLLKTSVNVLMSLSNDPHPTVHFWALRALGEVINAASLAYSPFLLTTLGMLFKVYSMDTHEPEGGTLVNVNASGDLPTYQAICQILDAIVGVLGPELNEPSRTRALVLDLVTEFWEEEEESVRADAIKCIQHVLMFGPETMDIPSLVDGFRKYLSSQLRPLKTAATNALYQLVQRDALLMSKLGGDRLVEELFGMLDDDPTIEGVRNIISSWLQQTVVLNPSAWIDLCQRIMSRTNASQQTVTVINKGAGLQDDEAESLSTGISDRRGAVDASARLTSRWRTQLFALQCLHQICQVTSNSGRKEHIDLIYAKSVGLPISGLLVNRIPDLIKMAFTASATHVTEIRLEGLAVIRDVIEVGACPEFLRELIIYYKLADFLKSS
jgi:HEAT repeat-containing protein 5